MSDFSDISICKHGQRYCPDDAQIGCSRCEADHEDQVGVDYCSIHFCVYSPDEGCQECEDDFVEKLGENKEEEK